MLYSIYCCMASNASFKSAPSVAPPRFRVPRLLFLAAIDRRIRVNLPLFGLKPNAKRRFMDFLPNALFRLETMRPFLVICKLCFLSPPVVISATLCQTCALLPRFIANCVMFSTKAFENNLTKN